MAAESLGGLHQERTCAAHLDEVVRDLGVVDVVVTLKDWTLVSSNWDFRAKLRAAVCSGGKSADQSGTANISFPTEHYVTTQRLECI